jgi:hypothetical protein
VAHIAVKGLIILFVYVVQFLLLVLFVLMCVYRSICLIRRAFFVEFVLVVYISFNANDNVSNAKTLSIDSFDTKSIRINRLLPYLMGNYQNKKRIYNFMLFKRNDAVELFHTKGFVSDVDVEYGEC